MTPASPALIKRCVGRKHLGHLPIEEPEIGSPAISLTYLRPSAARHRREVAFGPRGKRPAVRLRRAVENWEWRPIASSPCVGENAPLGRSVYQRTREEKSTRRI